jgi:hypothetical protein
MKLYKKVSSDSASMYNLWKGASLGFNSCKHVFTGCTLKQSLRKLFCTASLVVFRMHCWFFIRTQDQQTTYQFSELLLTTWVKLAKQVQIFLKAHHQHFFSWSTTRWLWKHSSKMPRTLQGSHFKITDTFPGTAPLEPHCTDLQNILTVIFISNQN